MARYPSAAWSSGLVRSKTRPGRAEDPAQRAARVAPDDHHRGVSTTRTGTASEENLKLLASWAATVEQDAGMITPQG